MSHFPWYSPEAQERRATTAKEAHQGALQVRESVNRVLDDYRRADVRRKP